MSERVAVVTGGGSGMGRAIALALAAEGAHVVVAGRSPESLEATAALSDGRVTAHVCDVAEPASVDALFDSVLEAHGRVDVLVCSHGTYTGDTRALDLDLGQYDRTMAVNVRGTLHCVQRAGRAMADGGEGGRVVLISSMNGEASQRGAVDYDVSKAAVNGLTRALAVELADHAITVNAIAPGWVRTPMSDEELAHLEGEGLVMNPLHAVGEPDDVARAALYLTDPRNGFVTGAVLRLDGGQTAMLPTPWPAASTSLV